ncbi:hypothetical protein ATY78_26920 [Rhizobium sp. R635]|nr:hypothetical protein ATY78_26920 [Rhizobium sp. R635]
MIALIGEKCLAKGRIYLFFYFFTFFRWAEFFFNFFEEMGLRLLSGRQAVKWRRLLTLCAELLSNSTLV